MAHRGTTSTTSCTHRRARNPRCWTQSGMALSIDMNTTERCYFVAPTCTTCASCSHCSDAVRIASSSAPEPCNDRPSTAARADGARGMPPRPMAAAAHGRSASRDASLWNCSHKNTYFHTFYLKGLNCGTGLLSPTRERNNKKVPNTPCIRHY